MLVLRVAVEGTSQWKDQVGLVVFFSPNLFVNTILFLRFCLEDKNIYLQCRNCVGSWTVLVLFFKFLTDHAVTWHGRSRSDQSSIIQLFVVLHVIRWH